MRKSNVIKVSFKKPEPQSVLNGSLGLTTQDIADSLGIDVTQVRRKLSERGMLGRIKACNFNCMPIGILHPVNGTEYTDYVLDVNAAKFFIARYENKKGDAYLKYLVDVESDAQAEGLTSHIDPTGIDELVRTPEFAIHLANKWQEALTRAEKAEATIITNKDHADEFAAEHLKPMAVWFKEFPILEAKGMELKRKATPNMAATGCLTRYIVKVLKLSPSLARHRKGGGGQTVTQYDKATILKVVEELNKEKEK